MSPLSQISSSHITAVILAGGASTRMGSDKALLQWRGRPFAAHIIERLQPQADRIAINTLAASDFSLFGVPLIPDATAQRCGPLAGVMAALDYSSTPLTLIVPCDNPLVSPQLTARLSAAMANDAIDVAYACVGDDNFYLYALMRTPLRTDLAEFLKGKDYAVRHWYARLRTIRVDFSDQPAYFRNINGADDLALLPAN